MHRYVSSLFPSVSTREIDPALSDSALKCAASQPVVSTAIGEDKGRFQVALLTLGATHARFGHTEEALSSLNESVRLFSDYACIRYQRVPNTRNTTHTVHTSGQKQDR